MARTAFEDAIAELDNVAEDSYKDSTNYHAADARQSGAVDVGQREPEAERGQAQKEVWSDLDEQSFGSSGASRLAADSLQQEKVEAEWPRAWLQSSECNVRKCMDKC